MPYISVSSLEYGELFQRLLSKRLKARGEEFFVKGQTVLTGITRAAAGAISDSILRDVKPLELARLVSLLPVSLREKRAILPAAIAMTKENERSEYVTNSVLEFMQSDNVLIAEGFLRFRLPQVYEDWAIAVDRAGEEVLLRMEFAELLESVSEKDDRENGLTVLVLNDGETVIRDEKGLYIEAKRSGGLSIPALLVSLAPSSVTVYDLTGGKERELLLGIRTVFGNRASFFIQR